MAGTSGTETALCAFCPAMTLHDLRPPVIDRHHVALEHAGAKARHLAVAPDFGADGLARIDRRREAPGHRGEPRRIVTAKALEQRVARHPEGGKAVQDRKSVV